MTRVYVAESGEYEQRGIDDIYATVADAVEALKPENLQRALWCCPSSEGWYYWQEWIVGKTTLTLYEVIGSPPSPPTISYECPVTIQVYREDNGGWLYVESTTAIADELMTLRGKEAILKRCRELGLSAVPA